jgi:hypothetical protein
MATGFGRLLAKAASKHKGDEQEQNCRLSLNQSIHTVLPSFSPLRCLCGSEEQEPTRECPPPDSDPFNAVEF